MVKGVFEFFPSFIPLHLLFKVPIGNITEFYCKKDILPKKKFKNENIDL